MLITLGSLGWVAMAAASAVSAVMSLFWFRKSAQDEEPVDPNVWGPEHDHEAEYQKLRARLGNGRH